MMTKKILIATLLACVLAPALAEETGEETGATQERVERRIVTRLVGTKQYHLLDGLPMAGGLMHGGRAVKNAPYSALSVSEHIQHLADGNQLVNKRSAMNYRDSAGRTRTEIRDRKGDVRVVTIHDPVEGVRYMLHPKNKTATKIAAPGEAARRRIAQLRQEGKRPESGRVIVKEVERDGEHKEVRIRIAKPRADESIASREMSAQLGPMIAGAVADARWSAKAVSKELGTRDFSGVKAQGRQRSYEIPAEVIGNRDPITVTSETWTSPELQMTVYHKRSDPRSGEMVYRLEELKRDEPAAALFTVPADYTVREALNTGKRATIKKGE